MGPQRRIGATLVAVALALAVARPAAACPGDCDGTGSVSIDELISLVDIGLGARPVADCAAADLDANGSVTIAEVVAAVASALSGCPAPPPPMFRDVTLSAGVDYLQQVHNTPPTSEAQKMSAGAAAGDFDGDGWVDLFVTRYDAPDLLFRNRGDGTFDDATVAAGLAAFALHSNGAAWGDIDNDGDLDLYVTALGPEERRHFLFVNDGNGHFDDETMQRGAGLESADPHYGFSAAFGDYDRDGWIDLHVTEWRPDAANPTAAPSNTRLLRNRGAEAPGSFVDVTDEAGVAIDGLPTWTPSITGGLGFTSRFSDLDDDGWPDLLVAADYGTSRLFWNRGDGTFIDGTAAAMVGREQNGMGIAVGDYDGDGRLDWFVSSVYDPTCTPCRWGTSGNRLYHNDGGRVFSDRTDAAGVRDGSWGWAASFLDYDNDGALDLAMVNGVPFAERFERDPMRLWHNSGGVFSEVAAQVGVTETRLGQAVVVFDYDRDGDLDLFVANRADHPALYRNDGGNAAAWLRLKLIGTASNRDALGARVVVTPDRAGPSQVAEVSAGSNHLSQNESVLHFGLGSRRAPVARVEIRWPIDGRVQVLHDVPINQLLSVAEPSG